MPDRRYPPPLGRNDPATKTGTLAESYIARTRITGTVAASGKVRLQADGTLKIQQGYVWDYGSGPAINTPAMVAASLPHDALYQLIRDNKLTSVHRAAADLEFYHALRQNGTGVIRAALCYIGVRVGGRFHV